MTDLSLFGIESGLHELFDAWQSAETPEEVEAAEVAIRACAEAEVREVDNIRRYWRACDQMAAAAKHEAATQTERARLWESRRERLKAVVYAVMDQFKLKKIEGQTGSLLMKSNGGKQAVEVYDESLVPDEYCTVTVTMPVKIWNATVALQRAPKSEGAELHPSVKVSPRAPANSLIAEALNRNCPLCEGEGVLKGCVECGGSGKQSVPGCRLAPRGVHVECR